MFTYLLKPLLFLVFLFSIAQSVPAEEHYTIHEVEYQTDDGWTISGTLRLPAGADADNEFAGMVLLHEKEHDRNDFVENYDTGIAQQLPINGIASLAIDWRGREKSMGDHQPVSRERHDFSTRTTEQMYLDVKGALEFLAGYPGVDEFRLGILASQFSAEHAVKGMRETQIPTRVLVLLGGDNLSMSSKEYLASVEIPLFTAASILDRKIFAEMAQVYANAKNLNSKMVAPNSAGRGYNLMYEEVLREGEKNENTMTRQDVLVGWLVTELKNIGRVRPVSLQTEDGWTIYGNFRFPDELGRDGREIPGVITVAGARSNRYSMYAFEEEMARRGYAVLSIEMRGRGASMAGGTVDSPEVIEVETNLLSSPFELDTVAAIDYISGVDGIDEDRIGIIGTARGSRSSLLAAAGDRRIKAMTLLSVYRPDNEMEAAIDRIDAPILFIDTETNWAAEGTRYMHRRARNSQMMIFRDLGHSHHIRYFHPEVVEVIGDFMEEELPR